MFGFMFLDWVLELVLGLCFGLSMILGFEFVFGHVVFFEYIKINYMTCYIYSLQVYSSGLCFEVRFGFGFGFF